MEIKMIKFDNSKQNISDLIDEITNTIKESIDDNKAIRLKDMIADTKMFVDWAKDYNKVDDLLHQNIIVALNNLKKVSKEELEILDTELLDKYFGVVDSVETILYNYVTNICEDIKKYCEQIIDKRTKSSYKFTKEDLDKLRKEELINMILNEEEPKKEPRLK